MPIVYNDRHVFVPSPDYMHTPVLIGATITLDKGKAYNAHFVSGWHSNKNRPTALGIRVVVLGPLASTPSQGNEWSIYRLRARRMYLLAGLQWRELPAQKCHPIEAQT